MNDSGVRGGGRDDGVKTRVDDAEAATRADESSDGVIEPGNPSAENGAFVLLGVLAALYVLARIAGLV